MRIISTKSVLMSLMLVMVLINTVLVESSEAAESNVTKTNLKIKNNLFITEDGLIGSNFLMLPYDADLMKQLEAKKQAEKKEALAKIRKANKLPEGKFEINASAYTAAADECGKSDGITASGKKVKENETIACPKSFPFGTKISIEGMGTFICQDRGGAIKGNKIDIYMETKQKAFAFGRRTLNAEIIE